MRAALLLAAVALSGCDNSCQTLCVNMAQYSEECGRSVSDSELQACIDAFEDPSAEEQQACRDFGQPDVIAREWTCEDVNLFRDGA